MGEESAGTRASAAADTPHGGRLRELCTTAADARRRLAASASQGPGDLHARLAAVVTGLAQAQVDARDRASLIALLDEISGLVGQLELERAAALARIMDLDRHRQAQLSYAKVRRPQ